MKKEEAMMSHLWFRRRLVSAAVPAFFLVLSCALELQAQIVTGTIKGTIRDSSGAVMVNVPVTVKDLGTAITRQGMSNAAGDYVVADVPAAQYAVSVQYPGFQSWTTNLTLRTAQTAEINIVLDVGQISTQVEVKDSTPIINTVESTLSNTLEGSRILQLPLNGRDLAQLFQLTPGVNRTAGTRMNGIQSGAFQFLQDGISIENKYNGDIVNNRPAMEGVAEYHIESADSDAKYSRTGTVILTTRSGTNSFHGSIFDVHRNNGWGLVTRQYNQGINSKPAFLIRNEFGASLGGPVRIPKLYNGKDKTFFFFTYEGRRQNQSQPIVANSPPAELRNGDFSHYYASDMSPGQVAIIYDPMTTRPDPAHPGFFLRDPFPGNIIPPERISAMAKAALPFYPMPNQPGLDYWSGNIRVTNPLINNLNSYTAKLDHHFSENDVLTGSYSFIDQANTQTKSGYGGTPSEEFYFNKGTSRTQVISLGETHIFNPNTVNEIRLGGTRPHDHRGPPPRTPARTTLLNLPNATGDTGWPCLVPEDEAWSLDAGLHFDDDNPQTAPQTFYTVNDNVSMVRRSHHINVGGNFRDLLLNSDERGQPRGCYEFDWFQTGLEGLDSNPVPGTGSGLAAFLLGNADYAALRSDKGFFYHRQKEFQTYIQDDWRLNSHLTLNLGLRYELYTRYHDKRNQIATFDPASGAIVTPLPVSQIAYPAAVAAYEASGVVFKSASEVGLPENLFQPQHKDFAPRVGLAYKINDKTVVRGGFGMYYWTTPTITLQAPSRQNPPFNFTRQAASGDTVTYLTHVPSFEMGNTPPDQIFGSTQLSVGTDNIGVSPFDPYMKDSWVDQWNITIERKIPWNSSLRLSYVGNQGHNLQISDPINSQLPASLYPDLSSDQRRKYPIYNDMQMLKTLGYSANNQMQIQFKHTTQKGILMDAFYVYQSTLDTSEFSAAAASPNGILGAAKSGIDDIYTRIALGHGPSSYEPRHRLTYNFLIDMPFGRGHRFGNAVSPALNKLIGGWQVASISTFSSGSFFTNGLTASNTGSVRVCNGNLPNNQRTISKWFDTSCFVRSDDAIFAGTPFGKSVDQPINPGRPARNVLVGPGFANVDGSVFKNTPLHENLNLRFTADFFNLPNHPALSNPNATSGRITGQANGPRIIQFSLRLEF